MKVYKHSERRNEMLALRNAVVRAAIRSYYLHYLHVLYLLNDMCMYFELQTMFIIDLIVLRRCVNVITSPHNSFSIITYRL